MTAGFGILETCGERSFVPPGRAVSRTEKYVATCGTVVCNATKDIEPTAQHDRSMLRDRGWKRALGGPQRAIR